MYNELYKILTKYNQTQILDFWDELDEEQKNNLATQIKNINWEQLEELIKKYVQEKPETLIPDDLAPVPYFPSIPVDDEQEKLYSKAIKKGKELIAESKVAAFTVAGGQGTRLGFDGPKGTFPITPVKGKTLFQYFAETIKRASAKYESIIPWYIMTSRLNNNQTVAFFEENNYFGLSSEHVIFVQQGTMPAFNSNGRLLLDTKSSLSLAPDGHGGSLLALRKSGALDDMKKRGIEYISYFQVDNPLVSIINPLFIGLHLLTGSEMSAIMLAKTEAFEKIGNFCTSGGKTMIIEYSDMPDELAEKKDCNGNLCFIAGSPAIHVISRSFAERLTLDSKINLPWHRAEKKVPYIDKHGKRIMPEEVNAVKLESFIFDALPMADKTMILEAERDEEFAPTKNKEGVDSVESCRRMLISRDCKWLEKYADIDIPKDNFGNYNITLELSPASFIDDEDVNKNRERLKSISFAGRERIYIE